MQHGAHGNEATHRGVSSANTMRGPVRWLGCVARSATLLATLLAACAGSADASRPDDGPQRDETLAIASFHVFALQVWQPQCVLARDATEWARARAALGIVGRPLPEQPCTFDDFVAVLTVLPMGLELARLDASTSTEEGVDVLTITRTFDEPAVPEVVGRAYLSQTALVVLPQRPRQLAVVLKTLRGASIEEETLAVFDGVR